jgi:hypothetical protein
MERIDEGTPCRRRSPNAVYVDDVLIGTIREPDARGMPFKGRVTAIHGSSVVLENGYGGSQWVERSSLRTER